ncbi:MAG: hypothetical protein AB7F91_08855 [Parvularculaceae bacterium]
MTVHRLAALFAITIILSGCATHADPATLSQSSGDDVILIAERNDFGSLDLVLEGVDLDTGKFTNRRVELSSNGDSLSLGSAAQPFNKRYVAKRVPAGDYAAVGTISSSYGYVGRRRTNFINYNCYSEGASTMRLAPGGTYFVKTDQGRLAAASNADIASADAALTRAGVRAAPAETTAPTSLISFEAGRNLMDKLTASASCPAGKTFKIVANGADIERIALEAIWRPADCRTGECAGPTLSASAVQALSPAFDAYRDADYQKALQTIDSAFAREAFKTKSEFYGALYLRVLTLVKLDADDVALTDGERLLSANVMAEKNLVNLRLLLGAIRIKRNEFAAAHKQLSPALKYGDINDVRILSSAVHAAAKAGQIDDTLAYIRDIEAKKGVAEASLCYRIAFADFRTDGREEAANRIAETFAATRGMTPEEAREVLSKK